MQERRVARLLEAPRAWISAGVLVVLLAGVVSGLRDSAPAQAVPAAPTAQQGRVIAVDLVAPQPISLSFAKPAAPKAPTAKAPAAPALRTRSSATAPRSARPRPVAAAPRVVASSSDCVGPGWEQRRGARALDSLRYGAPAGVTISFLPGRGSLKGMTFYDRHAVEVYVQSCRQESDRLLRHVVAHELGHAWDSLHMTDALRADYLDARGIPAGTPWFGCSQCTDFATPAGDFAETYAQWQRGSADSRSEMAAPATAAELQQLSRFFR
jgi:hypothetical protein